MNFKLDLERFKDQVNFEKERVSPCLMTGARSVRKRIKHEYHQHLYSKMRMMVILKKPDG